MWKCWKICWVRFGAISLSTKNVGAAYLNLANLTDTHPDEEPRVSHCRSLY